MNCTQVGKANSLKHLETTFSKYGNSSSDIHIRIVNGGCGNENNCISFAQVSRSSNVQTWTREESRH